MINAWCIEVCCEHPKGVRRMESFALVSASSIGFFRGRTIMPQDPLRRNRPAAERLVRDDPLGDPRRPVLAHRHHGEAGRHDRTIGVGGDLRGKLCPLHGVGHVQPGWWSAW